MELRRSWRSAASSSGTGCSRSWSKNASESRTHSGKRTGWRSSMASVSNSTASSTKAAFFTASAPPAARIWSVKRQVVIRRVCSRTSAIVFPPTLTPSRPSQRRIEPAAQLGGAALYGGMRDVPRHRRGERAADAVVHALGLAAALAACAALAAAAPRPAGVRVTIALGLYAAGLLAMLGCSALYNLASEGAPRKGLLRRLDHAAIF